MVRKTRSSARRATSPDSSPATPTTNASPVFSARNSIKEETPATSDQEDVQVVKRKLPMRVTSITKRPAESDSEAEGDSESSRAPKRRASSNRAYVEITNNGSNKGSKVNLFPYSICP
ncbi:hypothetical protein FA15DRAFT_47188 [Coprinopsis marcescibilis]|uniref:Uncharacterized protein n=1 Tax=Coprinopsis marcescibilis TaxID=230819 RepID=A0A5C3KPB8_COPMA|nr:hypothetical protein FA15DRAFT_47188 [Coprinopsis marcescibilis]